MNQKVTSFRLLIGKTTAGLVQHFIEKNGSGILAFINPHGFLDNPTFRGMRWNLLKTFDKIYSIDLHGNSKKKETSPDGSKDENVFDIQQGVSINFFIKTGKKKESDLGKIFHHDLFGRREEKYSFLIEKKLNQIEFKEVNLKAPMYYFVNINSDLQSDYIAGFFINEIFKISLLGPTSHRDDFAISFDPSEANERISNLLNRNISDNDLRFKYKLKDNRDWSLSKSRALVQNSDRAIKCLYRPFDFRSMLYGSYAFDYHRPQLNDELLKKNLCVIYTRQTKENFSVFISGSPLGQHKIVTPYDGSYGSPLYLYPETSGQLSLGANQTRTPNLNMEIVDQIATGLGLAFVPEKPLSPETSPDGRGDSVSFAPIDLLDYIYAVLHSPTYRETYKEFLKIDFPRVPYPTDSETFWKLVQLGGELRQLHLMESPILSQLITQYPISGENEVEKISFVIASEAKQSPSEGTSLRGRNDRSNLPNETASTASADLAVTGRVYINAEQYFDGVPEIAWNFYIGGYQPAQKWLKDRKGRTLDFEDIMHYQRIIKVLTETERVMREIDGVGIVEGGEG